MCPAARSPPGAPSPSAGAYLCASPPSLRPLIYPSSLTRSPPGCSSPSQGSAPSAPPAPPDRERPSMSIPPARSHRRRRTDRHRSGRASRAASTSHRRCCLCTAGRAARVDEGDPQATRRRYRPPGRAWRLHPRYSTRGWRSGEGGYGPRPAIPLPPLCCPCVSTPRPCCPWVSTPEVEASKARAVCPGLRLEHPPGFRPGCPPRGWRSVRRHLQVRRES